jgi:autotransporter strand-loop-strand O-heptosyltransferase
MNSFKVSYVTTLPKQGNAPSVTISGDIPHRYLVIFCDKSVGVVSSGYCETNQVIVSKTKQWYTEWTIVIQDSNGKVVFYDDFNPRNKVVFIKMDSYALGDTIAWIPYVEEFRKKHDCTVICSTFKNSLFVNAYPNILFVNPNTVIENVYAQFYIGAIDEDNPYYCPVKAFEVPLQMVASEILGLPWQELRPDLSIGYEHIKHNINKKYVTIAEFGSSENKSWKAENGWQQVVDFLVGKGYDVVAISKEPTQLKNVIDMTGDSNLSNRIIDIMNAEYHIGVSSGLSWLAWALGTHVVMISDTTPKWHEFQSNITRICANDLTRVNYEAEGQTIAKDVILKLDQLEV